MTKSIVAPKQKTELFISINQHLTILIIDSTRIESMIGRKKLVSTSSLQVIISFGQQLATDVLPQYKIILMQALEQEYAMKHQIEQHKDKDQIQEMGEWKKYTQYDCCDD